MGCESVASVLRWQQVTKMDYAPILQMHNCTFDWDSVTILEANLHYCSRLSKKVIQICRQQLSLNKDQDCLLNLHSFI